MASIPRPIEQNQSVKANIYPDFTNGQHDLPYVKRIIFQSDLPDKAKIIGRFKKNDVDTEGPIQLELFRVGPGAPMENGATTYTNSRLINNNFEMKASGIEIHQLNDDSGERYCHKDLASDTITVNGGVSTGEVIKISTV